MPRLTPEEKLRIARYDLRSCHPDVLAERTLFNKNPELYYGFVDATLNLLERGYPRFSQWMVANYVRYNVMSSRAEGLTPGEQGREFKVPNGVIAVWARQFIVQYPEYADVFSIKPMAARLEA